MKNNSKSYKVDKKINYHTVTPRQLECFSPPSGNDIIILLKRMLDILELTVKDKKGLFVLLHFLAIVETADNFELSSDSADDNWKATIATLNKLLVNKYEGEK